MPNAEDIERIEWMFDECDWEALAAEYPERVGFAELLTEAHLLVVASRDRYEYDLKAYFKMIEVAKKACLNG